MMRVGKILSEEESRSILLKKVESIRILLLILIVCLFVSVWKVQEKISYYRAQYEAQKTQLYKLETRFVEYQIETGAAIKTLEKHHDESD